MFLEELEAKARELLSLEADHNYVERIEEMKRNGDMKEISLMFRNDENASAYMLLNSPELLSEDDLVDMLFCSNMYSRYKSAEILTRMYEHKEHRKEYLPFFKKMLKDNTSYDESNYLFCLLIDFLSYKSNNEFDVEKRKLELASNKMFLEILDVSVFVKEVQYNTLMVILVLSYNTECIERMGMLIEDVIVIIKEKTREKVLRVCYGIIVNVFRRGYKFSPGRLNDISKCTELFLKGNYKDIELVSDLSEVRDRVAQANKSFCTLNYLKELFSGRFEDSEYHHRDDFWISNIDMLMKNKVGIVKVLKKYLKSNNSAWVCLACNDIFQLVKAAPDINNLLAKYQVKESLFSLIHSNDDDIRFHAIQALYMCIFSEWT